MSTPNQPARERAEKVAEPWRYAFPIPANYIAFVEELNKALTADEQAAYQRGKEEGRREERERCADTARVYTNRDIGGLTATNILNAILAADPPTTPEPVRPIYPIVGEVEFQHNVQHRLAELEQKVAELKHRLDTMLSDTKVDKF